MIELVIKIPEEYYELLKTFSDETASMDMLIIKNGTPLPKHHGRLIDVKQIVYEKECIWETDGCCTTRSTPNIGATPTIIEADKESDSE